MSSTNDKRFQTLYTAATKAYPELRKQKIQEKVIILWNEIKKTNKKYEEELDSLNSIALKKRTSGGLIQFLTQTKQVKRATPVKETPNSETVIDDVPSSTSDSKEVQTPKKKVHKAPVQTEILNQIQLTESSISELTVVKNRVGLSFDHHKQLKRELDKKAELEKKFKRLQSNVTSKQRQRATKRKALEDIKANDPNTAKKLKLEMESVDPL